MIQRVNESCPGDCAQCEIAQNLPNFDYMFCMTYQMFRRIQRMQEEVDELKKNVNNGKVKFAVEAADLSEKNQENEGI